GVYRRHARRPYLLLVNTLMFFPALDVPPEQQEMVECAISAGIKRVFGLVIDFGTFPVPKIDSAFDNLLVPQQSWSPSTTQQPRKLVAAPYLAPI
ncbi:hypothetical protein, partial [Thiolapillus sp.]|uniref:hypothetical protein n=4 Tax=Thiolapillus sp. TaxID=2017437 RepID=UPI003AF88DD6